MKYKAILFDMDGVLIESEFLMRHSAIQALAEYGIEAKHEDFREFTGMGEDKFVGGVAEKYGHTYTFDMKERAYDYFGAQVKELAEVPAGVKEMLTTLHEKGLVMAVCSAADLRKVRDNIQAIGVDESTEKAFPGHLSGGCPPDRYGPQRLSGGRRCCQRYQSRPRSRYGCGRCAYHLLQRRVNGAGAS